MTRHIRSAAIFFLLLLLPGAAVRAQSDGPSLRSNEALVAYPDTVTFRLELAPDSNVVAATLNYDVVQRSCVDVSTRVPVELENGAATWTWVMSRSGNPPPGTTVWWEWILEDAAGRTTTTPRRQIVLEDERFDWRMVETERLRLYWYRGDEVGPLLLAAASDGLSRLESDMGITVPDRVTFYIYGSAADMRDAVLYIQDWAGGVAFAAYNTILIGVPPDSAEGWGRETVRHELAHLVLEQAGWSCLGGSRPSWLEEGMAVYAEGPADAQTEAEIRMGIEDDAFLPLRSLNGSFPSDDAGAGIAYSESYSVVTFLLDRYGKASLQALLDTLAQGAGYDEALNAVYGFNVDGLEVRWREAIGAPPRSIPPTPTPLRAAAVPTVPPMEVVAAVATPPAAAATAAPAPAPATPSLCAAAFAPLLLLGGAGLWSRRRRQ
jgi:hypothetical protein